LGIALVATSLAVTVAQVGFGIAQTQVLFSGNNGMADLVKQTSISSVLVILLCRGVAYTVALGGGLRGGQIFPATFLGVIVAVGASLTISGVSVAAMAATGISASAAVMLKLPATSALLAALLVGGSGAAIAPFAIMGAVIGMAVRVVLDARSARTPAAPSVQPTAPN